MCVSQSGAFCVTKENRVFKRTDFLCMSNNVVEVVPSVSQKRTEFLCVNSHVFAVVPSVCGF